MLWTKYRQPYRSICLLQGVFGVRQPVGTNQVWRKKEHIAVLAGDKQVSEMLVFIMYRKLKVMLNIGNVQEQSQEPEENGKG